MLQLFQLIVSEDEPASLVIKKEPKSMWDDEDVDENDIKDSWEDEDEPTPVNSSFFILKSKRVWLANRHFFLELF